MVYRTVFAIVTGTVLSGCSCNSEYTWDERELNITSNEAPLDYGAWLSMDVAPDGERLVLAYYDKAEGAVGFAVGTVGDSGVSWAHEEVDGYAGSDGLDPGDRGKYTSMEVANNGTVWVAYQNVSGGNVWAAQRTGKEWVTELVDAGTGSPPAAGAWCSLAMGANGQPIVAYEDKNAGALKLAHRREDGTWTTEVIHTGTLFSGTDATGNAVIRLPGAEYMDLLVHENTEYLAFYEPAQQELLLYEGSTGSYTRTLIDRESGWPNLLLDGNTLHIAYHDIAAQDLKLASREGGGSFDSVTVDSGEYRGADTALFMRDGEPGIVYFDGHNNDMLYAQFTGSGWTKAQLGGDDGAVGFHNEVVQLGDGSWWAGSYNYTERTLFLTTLE